MIVRNVKVDITPEAAKRIAELGLEEELERVAAYTRSTVPTLSEIRVETWVDPDDPAVGEYLSIVAVKDAPYARHDPEHRAWKKGVIEMISDDFRRWFTFDLHPREVLNGRPAVS